MHGPTTQIEHRLIFYLIWYRFFLTEIIYDIDALPTILFLHFLPSTEMHPSMF